MNGAFHVAATGLNAQQRALDTLAGNVANLNTPAFKRSSVRFVELLSGTADPGRLRADLTAGASPGAGVRSDAVFLLDEQGPLRSTGRAMDVAIDGAGFIELMGPGGQTLLWRGGPLRVGEDGMLASEFGMALRAAVTIPTDAAALEIDRDGTVRARTEGGETVELGQIMLVRLEDPNAIERMDGGLYRLVDGARTLEARPGEDGAGLIVQGSLEGSNVELAAELVQLMLVQRAFAANAQLVQAADQMMALANGLRR